MQNLEGLASVVNIPGRSAVVHSKRSLAIQHHGCSPQEVVTKEEATILVVTGPKIEVCNLSGTVKKSLQFSVEVEGTPSLVDVGGTTLIASTSKQMLRMWNVARTTPKALGSARRFEDKDGNLYGEIRSLRANC